MAMFQNPGTFFVGGTLTPVEQRFIAVLLKNAHKQGYTRFVEPCAGAFAMSHIAAQCGYKPSEIEASDVSMFTSIMGYAITGQSLEELEIRADGFTNEELLDPAVALYAWKYLKATRNAGREYGYELMVDLEARREYYIDSLRAQLDRAKQLLHGMSYRPLDMWKHLEECYDDPHCIVIANPPTYTAGFEKWYDTGGRMTWKEPEYGIFDPKTEMQKQLTDNIKKRGQLESLPFCALIDGKIEIISGHHRIRSAKDSGVLTELFVILDTTGLRRSQVAAKQLAHNAISGFDDQSTLKEIAKMIDDVDDMLESYIGKDIIGEPMAELEKLLSPKVEFDWKNVTFTFLPHQLRDLDQLVKVLGSLSPDMLGVADIDQHEEFIETITKYQQFANVKNTGAAIHAMIKATESLFDDLHFDESQEWVQLPNLFGSPAIPKEAADTITQALDKMVKEGEIGPKNKWQALEYWAADYLAGK